jgi:hypothetical protein
LLGIFWYFSFQLFCLFLKFVRTSPLLQQMKFQWYFTCLICSSGTQAYHTGFSIEYFCPSYSPLFKPTDAISSKLNRNDQC